MNKCLIDPVFEIDLIYLLVLVGNAAGQPDNWWMNGKF